MTSQASAPKGESRKVFLINPRFQLQVIGIFLFLALIILVLIYGANVYYMGQLEATGLALQLPPEHIYFQFITAQKSFLVKIYASLAFLLLTVITILGLILSHKIAGPIYRLNKYIDSVIAGKTKGELTFRKNDFFPEVADKMNDLLRHFKIIN